MMQTSQEDFKASPSLSQAQIPSDAAHCLNDLDAPLLRLSDGDHWRVRDALEGGTQIFGSPGSGKTSGSGKAIAHAMLRAGWGFLVLCAKPDERARWQRYAAECGREQSVVIFDGSGQRRFNFLSYALATQAGEGGLTENVVALLTHVLDAAEGRVSTEGGDPFWKHASGELLSHCIDLLWSAYGRVSLFELVQLINSRPMYPTQATEAAFKASSFWAQTMSRAMGLDPEPPAHRLRMHDQTVSLIFSYFVYRLAQGDQKTPSNIIATLSARLSRLLKGTLAELFTTSTNVVPEYSFEGGVLIIDLPALQYHEDGILAAHIWKYLWQRATLARTVTPTTRPVVCWADECQFFLASSDAFFVSNSRSQLGCTVYLTQNLPTYYSRIQAPNPQNVADSLIGCFANKIFHSQMDVRTNQFASELIGKELQLRFSESGGVSEGENVGENQGGGSNTGNSSGTSGGSASTGSSASWGWSTGKQWGRNKGWSAQETVDYQLQPSYFTTLAKGGTDYGNQVHGVLVQGGRVFRHSRSTWIPLAFAQ